MNIINAAFVRNGVTIRTLPVYQYDSGMILNISGLDDLPSTFRADFANTETGQSKTVIGTDGQVHIPYEYFVPGATIHCWLVWSGEDYTVTRKHIMIPIARRATPTDEEPTPDEQSVIDQTISALNDAVAQTGQDVEAAAGYAGQAEQSAQAATDAQNVAAAAQNAAEAAKDRAVQSAADAAASAQSASESAQSASQSKADAQAAAASVAGAMDTLEATIQADLQAAKESGEFDGADGVSPAVTVTPITDGHQVMITDAEGEHTFDVTNGEPGADGFSPVATVTQTQTGATISITDKAGTTTAQISNGAKGDPGDDYVLTAQDKAEIAQQAEELLAPVLNEKADAIHTAAGPAPIVSIPDAAAAPVDALTVGIEPVQDLHGYDSPWPAGGGKNILQTSGLTLGAPSNTEYSNATQRTFTVGTYISGLTKNNYYNPRATDITVSDNLIKFTTPAPAYGVSIPITGLTVGLTYVVSATKTNGNIGLSFYKEDGTFISGEVSSPANYYYTATVPSETYYTLIVFSAQSDDVEATFTNIQLETGSSPTSYSPYSNICSISGWTGCEVNRTGNNLCPINSYPAGIYWESSYDNMVNFLNSLPVGTYTMYVTYTIVTLPGNGKVTHGRPYLTAVINGSQTPVLSYSVTNDTSPSVGKTYRDGGTFTITDAIQGNFNHSYFYCDQMDTHTGSERGTYSISNIQIELGSTATAYEPYQGSTYDITFPSEAGTVYGGTLDVTNGVLTVDRAGIASYAGETLPGEWISDRDVYAPGATPSTGAQVVYYLATPITYTLTPQEIRTLLGTNNIWADTGDVEVEYPADTKTYVDSKEPEIPVKDVQVNGASILNAQGVANVPVAGPAKFGAVQVSGYGLQMQSNGYISTKAATPSEIKAGTRSWEHICPGHQHISTFYGLTKAAGADMASSANPVGQYTDEAKVAIQKMLGIYEAPWELIREDTFTNETEADHIITTDANGEALELTDVVLMFETPKQSVEAKKGKYGDIALNDGSLDISVLHCGSWTQAEDSSPHGLYVIAENKNGLFFSMTKAQQTTTNMANLQMNYGAGFPDSGGSASIKFGTFITRKIKITAVTGTGHYKLYGKRKWQ